MPRLHHAAANLRGYAVAELNDISTPRNLERNLIEGY